MKHSNSYLICVVDAGLYSTYRMAKNKMGAGEKYVYINVYNTYRSISIAVKVYSTLCVAKGR